MHALKSLIQFERLEMTRIISTKEAINQITVPAKHILLRIAPDEAYVYPKTAVSLEDEWAIIKTDSGWAGAWIEMDTAVSIFEHTCEWELPSKRPSLAQGLVAGVPSKIWFEEDKVLLLVPASLAAEMEERVNL